MKAKWVLIIVSSGLFALSVLLLWTIYYHLPIEEVVNRQLLFGVTFQIWGMLATILIVKKILDMRDAERWRAINEHVFNWLYLQSLFSISRVLDVFKMKIDMKESAIINRFGLGILGSEKDKEWIEKAKEQLKEAVKGDANAIKKSMVNFQPSDHEQLSKIMEDLTDEIGKLLLSYPHNIPPEFLAIIVNVREKAAGIFKQSKTVRDIMDKQGVNYNKVNTAMTGLESKTVHDFFSELLKLLDIAEKYLR